MSEAFDSWGLPPLFTSSGEELLFELFSSPTLTDAARHSPPPAACLMHDTYGVQIPLPTNSTFSSELWNLDNYGPSAARPPTQLNDSLKGTLSLCESGRGLTPTLE